jgi:hypothetical protein
MQAMSFLDATEARESDARMRALHEVLIDAYPDKAEALAIAGQAGLHKADIEVHPKMRLTWWSILDEAAKAFNDLRLRRLVFFALKDPTIAEYRPALLDVLDVPEDQVFQSTTASSAADAGARGMGTGVGARAPLWPLGATVKVRFLEGDPSVHARIKEFALEWLEYVNLWLDFGDYDDAEVRVAFDRNMGTWSYPGTNCRTIPSPRQTMNFGWLDHNTNEREVRRVTLHEFGHVLGLQHEQNNPNSNLKWNKEKVYEVYTAAPNNWTREAVDMNVFALWGPGYYPFQKIFDPDSIEMWPIQADFLREGKAVGWNDDLSPLDEQFVAALYPKRER